MISVYPSKSECCGCGVCALVCPKGAINMRTDDEGFPFPHIEQELCTDCGACSESCAFQKGYAFETDSPQVYAVKHKEEVVRRASTSGGLFTAISDYIINQGGVVFGAKSDKNHQVIHDAARTKSERNAFRGSKYVKSDLDDSFLQVKQLLNEGKLVLFSGTPCQTAALLSFVGNHDKLITLDFVCHGTPSQLMLDEYIRYVEAKRKKKIVRHYHRIKNTGWGHTEANEFADGRVDYSTVDARLFMDLFYSNLNLNLSCYNCKYTNFRRPSDLTMGDYWGIDECMPDFYDNLGVSLLLVNSKKGFVIFTNIKDSLDIRESNKEDCSRKNLHLIQPNSPNPRREAFWQDYHIYGFPYVADKYGYRSLGMVKYWLIKLGLYNALKYGYHIVKRSRFL